MSEQVEVDLENRQSGLVQLRFADEEKKLHDLNAAEMAEAVQGLVEFTSQMAAAGLFGDGPPPVLRVRPPQEGSFVLEAVVWINENPDTFGAYTTAAAAITTGIGVGLKRLRGDQVTNLETFTDGYVKVTWVGGRVDRVPQKVWDQLETSKRKNRRTLRKLMAPLGDDVDTLEVRDGNATDTTDEILEVEAPVVAGRPDYRAAAQDTDETDEHVSEFDTEAQFESIDFKPGAKWRVSTVDETRSATIEDEDFTRELDNMALHKNDIFDVTIREVRTMKSGRIYTDWTLTKVVRTRRGAGNGNGGASSS